MTKKVLNISKPNDSLEGISFITKSAGQTKALGKVFSKMLKTGDVVFLDGDLGAGKTTFVQGLTKALGVKENARSSSFILVNAYAGKIIKKIFHIDLYRLADNSYDELGFEEYFTKDSLALVEWPGRLKGALARADWIVKFILVSEKYRQIRIERNK